MSVQVFVRQKFNVRRKRGDRTGFTIIANTEAEAIAELEHWRKCEIEIAGSPSFQQADFYDREAFNADPLGTKPYKIVKAA